MKRLLKDGVDVNARNKSGRTAAHWAAMDAQLCMMKLLASYGADLNTKDNDGRTPAHFAAMNADAAVMEFLSVKNADLDAKDNDGQTLVHWAAKHDQSSVIKFASLSPKPRVRVFATKGCDVHSADQATKSGHASVMKFLVSKGANLNAMDNHGRTPAHWAAMSAHASLMNFMSSCGANLNAKDNQGHTPAHWAAKFGDVSVIKFLFSKGVDFNVKDNQGQTLTHWAAMNAQPSVMEFLVSNGADLSAKDNGGRTPAHWASKFGHLSVIELLSTKAASTLHAKDYLGQTSAHCWASCHASLIWMRLHTHKELLASLALDFNAKDNDGRTPAHLAAMNAEACLLELYASAGAEFNAKDNDGLTPAHWAAKFGHKFVMEVLADNADLNAKDNQGHTPAHWAAKFGHLSVIKFLFSKGVDFNVKDNQGETPAHWAAMNAQSSVMEFLVSNGADLSAKDNDGRTPVHWVLKTSLTSMRCADKEVLAALDSDRIANDNDGRAANTGDASMMMLLTANGAEFGAQDNDEQIPIHHAASVVASMYNHLGQQLRETQTQLKEQLGANIESETRAATLRKQLDATWSRLAETQLQLGKASMSIPAAMPAAPPRPPLAMIGDPVDVEAQYQATKVTVSTLNFETDVDRGVSGGMSDCDDESDDDGTDREKVAHEHGPLSKTDDDGTAAPPDDYLPVDAEEAAAAAAAGDTDRLHRCIRKHPGTVHSCDAHGTPVLHNAARNNREGCTRLLLAEGANPLQMDADEKFAAEGGTKQPVLGILLRAMFDAHRGGAASSSRGSRSGTAASSVIDGAPAHASPAPAGSVCSGLSTVRGPAPQPIAPSISSSASSNPAR